MIDVKAEMKYILVKRLLEKVTAAGLLTPAEAHAVNRLAIEKYRPQTVWE